MGRILHVVLLIGFFSISYYSVKAQVSLTTSVTTYSQDFDALALSGTGNAWGNNSTLSGWFLFRQPVPGTAITAYNADNGGSNAGSFNSYGTASTNERALGAAASGGAYFGSPASGNIAGWIAAAFTNNTGSTLSSANITFDGEQWRNGGNATAQTMVLEYGFGTNFIDVTTWTAPGGNFDWTSPVATTTAAPVDGNVAGRVASKGGSLTGISWANGTNLWIRWAERNDTGNDHGLAIDNFSISISVGPDATPPTFTSTYPKTSNLSSSGFDLITNLNEPGKTYFVVLPNNAIAPTSTQVKEGKDATGTSLGAGLFGTIDVANATTDYGTTVAGLASATDYDVYVVAEDVVPNVQASPVKLDVLTNTAGDVAPPTFTATYPIVNNLSATFFTVRTNLDELGKTYFVVLPAGAAAPSSAQVKAGQDGSGTPVAGSLTGIINVTSAATEFTSQVTGLSPSTGYDVYIVAEDNVPNLQTNPTKVSVTTGALYLEDFNVCDGTASFTQFSVTGAQTWGCTDFGRGSTKGIRMNGFAGGAVDNQDWLISPAVTLSTSPSLSFYSQFSFAGPGLQLKISTNYTGSGDPTAATWIDLNGNFPTVAVPSSSSSLSDWTLSNVDLSAYASRNVYVAFVYTSTTGTNTAARWTLDEIAFNNALGRYMTVSTSSLNFINAASENKFILEVSNLVNDITVTAPPHFLVSGSDGNNFSNSIILSKDFGHSVHVRFNPPAGSSNSFSGLISIVSNGVSNRNVFVQGADKSQSLDITTFNLEFFGTDVKDSGGTEFGPTDDPLQISNVTTVMQTLGADIYGVQEVADDNAFNTLASNLSGYNKILANRWSRSFDAPDPNFPPQKIGFIYNTSTVQLVSSRVMFEQLYDAVRAGNASLLPGYPTSGGSTPSSFWSSGRLPFMATFDVTVNGATKRIRVVNVHAKSGSAADDYDRRKYDVKVLYDSLLANYANDNIIFLGDLNDDVDTSIRSGFESTYKPFVDNTTGFNALTLALSQAGGFSFPSSSSFIDHIITSNELATAYVSNSTVVDDPRSYISNYTNNTSDHLPVSARFLLPKTDQSITFAALPAKTFGDAAFALTATSSSGLPVTYTSSNTAVATISGNTVTIVGAGTTSITAKQAGDNSFNAAADTTQILTVNKANQAITFAVLPAKTFGDAAFALTATSSSALPVTYTSSNTAVATVSGSTVTIVGAGTTSITAKQAGDSNFNAAADVAQPLTVNKANQLITFALIADKTIGDAAFSFTATSNSGLAVTLTPNSKVTISGTQITIVSAGKASVTASQAGNTNYNAATSVVREFCIKPAKPTITLSNANTDAPTLTSSAATGNQWYLGTSAISGATNVTYVALAAGSYKVQVKVDDCISEFSAEQLLIVTGDVSDNLNPKVEVYPNPTTRWLTVKLSEKIGKKAITVLGLTGNELINKVVFEKETTFDLTDFPQGIYLLKVIDGNSVQLVRFIKN